MRSPRWLKTTNLRGMSHRKRFHNRERVVQQAASTEEITPGIANVFTEIPCLDEIAVHEACEKLFRPAGMHGISRGIEFSHLPPYAFAFFFHGYSKSRHPFIWDVNDVFCE